MAGFNFEKNLEHQEQAVKSIARVFDGVEMASLKGIQKEFTNPVFDKRANGKYFENISSLQGENQIKEKANAQSNIIDIMMETGTGKTYTYTKTIFELNKLYGIFKFVIVVPTLPIKAGTIDFLKQTSSREHFKEQYGKTIKLHIVESKNGSKNKKSFMPLSVAEFIKTGLFAKNEIQVLLINAGMVNSKTMYQTSDQKYLDKYSTPFEVISATSPFMIIDEPHKFDTSKTTWENISKMNPQFIIRYGATFPEKEIKQNNGLGKIEKIKTKDYHNLVYTLSAVDSFNRNLVKGVVGHITEFDAGKNAVIKFVNSDGNEAVFQLSENNKNKTFKIAKNESLEKVHSAMKDLLVENLNKTTVVLSNGLELKKGSAFNPYSFAETLQEMMIRKAIEHHFEQEKKYLTREVRIKPLTLFFIDNIEEYRNKQGHLRITVEKYIKSEIKKQLKEIDNSQTTNNNYYKNYLEQALSDVSKTHGGYFAVDKKETDEVIEKEINEILHDKQAILSLENPRRFIFSKWTLREGWDNPNIFQICKLRSSGSEISKLQEVGRGLRLPVNEYGNRVKDEQFDLNYFVDFTENDFVEKLKNEINEKSGAISRDDIPQKLTENYIKQITEKYNIKEEDLLKKLDDENVIKRNNDLKENGFEYIKANYPRIFEGVDSTKVRMADTQKKKLKVRVEKYSELKELWEKLNEKVVLEYRIENEKKFKELFVEFLKNIDFSIEGIRERTTELFIENNQACVREKTAVNNNKVSVISTTKYDDFLKHLSASLKINIKTIHQGFVEAGIDINKHLNQTTLRILKQKFDNFLMEQAMSKFSIEYQKIKCAIHPTKLTNEDGVIIKEVNTTDIGVFSSDERVADSYFFDELFYDSELEKRNIKEDISDVIVFTKIPKNSIKIPVAGGKSYSPDFAYVVNFKNGLKKLHFIIETKGVEYGESLKPEEIKKIEHAKKLFGDTLKIEFRTQLNNDKISDLIQEVYSQTKKIKS